MPNPRRLRDPRALAAVAHPVRMGIIELLSVHGPMTATELADRLDETPANCSWHLRKLAEHDFIEEAAGGTGRQRPWQMRHIGMSWAEDDDVSRDELRAGQALSRMLLERWVDRFLGASERETDPGWRDSAGLTQHVAWLTPEELADLTGRLSEVAGTYDDRLGTGERPEGARLCEIVAWGAAVEIEPMRAAFAQPGFTRLFAGLTTSMLGDSIMLLVLSIWVKTLTGSSAMAGFTFFFMCIPAIFAPFVGVWLDRIRRKPMLVWGNVASAVAVLPLLLVRDAGDVWIIWTVAGLYGVSFVVLPAGLNGLLKELMPERMLVDANSSIQTVKESYRLFGPLLGAALFAWLGGWAVALVDAASFLVAAAIISTIRVEEETPEHEQAAYWNQLTDGLRHLVHDRVLGHLLIGFGLSMLVLGFTESAIFALTDHFDRPATYVSVIVSVQGIGAVVGGIASARVRTTSRRGRDERARAGAARGQRSAASRRRR